MYLRYNGTVVEKFRKNNGGIENMKRFHYDKETGWGYLIKNNDIDGKPTIKIVFKVEG